MKNEYWSEDEINLLIEKYPKFGPKKCVLFFNNRTKKSIIRKAHNLNLNYEGQIWNNLNFIERAKLVHGDKYDYSLINCNSFSSKIIIICPEHGNFIQRTNCHIINGHGCPACKESKGEREIRNYLNKNLINFIPQYKIKECKHIKVLPFDFYLPDYNLCIEYQGIQHYELVKYFGGEKDFKLRLIKDKIKMEYCKNNNIPLLIIKYDEDVFNKLNKLF
jgi:hypothetical protein